MPIARTATFLRLLLAPAIFIVALAVVPAVGFAAPCPKADIDCWLTENPAIAHAIAWEVAPNQLKRWPEWESWRKRDLRATFRAARKWHDTGMGRWTGTVVPDPPPNKELLYTNEPTYAVLDEATAAWPLYIAHVAFSLAAEIDGWLPWSLADYDADELADLLTPGAPGGFGMFIRDSEVQDFWDTQYPGGYVPSFVAVPTHPTVTFKFLSSNHLIGSTPLQTIGRVLNWSRNLTHYLGGANGGGNNAFECHWGYRAPAPPVSRILAGTVACSDSLSGLRHWTAGCGGTTGFYAWLFRVVNIPVRRRQTCGHFQTYFSGENRYLSHSDDPYDQLTYSVINPDSLRYYDSALLLISASRWNLWFGGDADFACLNIGRRPVEIAVARYPYSPLLLEMYCADEVAGKTHAEGSLYEFFKPWYSLEQLEASNLWGRLATAIQISDALACQQLSQP